MFQCFVITLLKWIKYKNRLTFAYYSITFWDFKSLQSVPTTWQKLKAKNVFFKRCPNIEIPFIMISNPDFSLFFLVITGTAQCWKYLFPTIFFSKSRNTILKIFISSPPKNTTPNPLTQSSNLSASLSWWGSYKIEGQ